MNVTVAGEQELFAMFKGLKASTTAKIIRPAVRSSTAIVRATAKALVPVRYGALKKSLIVKMKTYSNTGAVVGLVGPDKEYVISKPPATKRKRNRKSERIMPRFYAHLVELGTVKSPKKPFLKPALKANEQAIISTFKQKLLEGLAKFGGSSK